MKNNLQLSYLNFITLGILLNFNLLSSISLAQETLNKNDHLTFQTDWIFSGSATFYAEPAALRNKSQFEGIYSEALLKLNLTSLLPEVEQLTTKDFINVRLQLFKYSKFSKQNLTPYLQEFYFSDLKENKNLRLGVILSPWVYIERKYWKGYLWGESHSGLWEHYKYLRPAEVGIDYGTPLENSSDIFNWKVGILSSDGTTGKTMFQKDVYYLLSLNNDTLSFGFGSQFGLYNGLPADKNLRTRSFIWLSSNLNSIQNNNNNNIPWLIEGFEAYDAVDGILGDDGSLGFAENIDVIQFGGESLHARGGAIMASLPITSTISKNNQSTRIHIKYDLLDPNLKNKKDSVSTTLLGMSFPWRMGEVFFNTLITHFQENHHTAPEREIQTKIGYSLFF